SAGCSIRTERSSTNTLLLRTARALRFEHDDGAFPDIDRGGPPRPLQDPDHGFECGTFRPAHIVVIERVADVELELRDAVGMVERNEGTVVANRHELHARQLSERLDGRDDDHGATAVTFQ